MAITLRGDKGAALTHNELDTNFREFYYSASHSDFSITLFKSKSLDDSFTMPVNVGKGPALSIQIKSGSAFTGSEATVTGSSNFTYDFGTDVLRITGSQNITGNLNVGGVVKAREVVTTISSSQILVSGSTRFGDSADDTHIFTGSLTVVGTIDSNTSITGSDVKIDGWSSISGSLSGHNTRIGTLEQKTLVSSSAQLASDISGSLGANATLIRSLTAASISGSSTLSNSQIQALGAGIVSQSTQAVALLENQNVNLGIVSASSLYTLIISSSVVYSSGSNIFGDHSTDTHQFTGSVSLGNTLSIPGFSDVSSSLASAVASGINNVSEDSTPELGGALDLRSNNITDTLGNGVISGSVKIDVTKDISGSLLNINGIGTSKFTSHLQAHCLGIGTSPSGTTGQINATKGVFSGDVEAVSGSYSGPLAGTTLKAVSLISGSTLDINGEMTGSALLVNGAINATGDITAFYSSDERLKDNITPIEGALDKLNQIGGYGFDWNDNSEHSGHDVGVIAQEIEKVLPEVVVDRDNGYKAVRYEKIVALLINAIKEQQLQIDELKSKL